MTRFQILALAVAVPGIIVGAELLYVTLGRDSGPESLSPTVAAGTSARDARDPLGAGRFGAASRPAPTSAAKRAPKAAKAGYRYAYAPAPAPRAEAGEPRIIEVDFNDRVLHAPGSLAFRVLTSDDVVLVRAQLMGREVRVPKMSRGVFGANATIPSIPPFLYGEKTVTVVATTFDGRRAESSVTVRVEH